MKKTKTQFLLQACYGHLHTPLYCQLQKLHRAEQHFNVCLVYSQRSTRSMLSLSIFLMSAWCPRVSRFMLWLNRLNKAHYNSWLRPDCIIPIYSRKQDFRTFKTFRLIAYSPMQNVLISLLVFFSLMAPALVASELLSPMHPPVLRTRPAFLSFFQPPHRD